MSSYRPFVAFVGLTLIQPISVNAQERWAALLPNENDITLVAWGSTADDASANAVAACKRVSNTCATRPATTSDMSFVFAQMCCTVPRLGCAAASGGTVKLAREAVRKVFSDAGFSSCSVRQLVSARTGKRVAGD